MEVPMPVAKNPFRPLEVSELSWILEKKIRGEQPLSEPQEKKVVQPPKKRGRKKKTPEST
jgi:hypothetical protein